MDNSLKSKEAEIGNSNHHISEILSVFEHAALFIVALFAVACTAIVPPQVEAQQTLPFPIVINEADRHTQEFTPGVNDDALDFIELYNQNDVPVSLSGYSIALYDGLTNTLTSSFDLTGTIPARGYYVIGSPAVPNVNLVRPAGTTEHVGLWFKLSLVGGTGVALYKTPAANLPSVGSSPIYNDSRIVDAIVIVTTGSQSNDMVQALTPNSTTAKEGAAEVTRIQSVGRITDGAGSVRNGAQWVPLIPTPGTINNGNNNVSAPAHPSVKVTVTAVNGTDNSVFTANENGGVVTAKVTAEIVGTAWTVPIHVALNPLNNGAVLNVTDTVTIPAGQTSASKNVTFTVKDNAVIESDGFYYGYFSAQGFSSISSRPFEPNRGWIKILDNDNGQQTTALPIMINEVDRSTQRFDAQSPLVHDALDFIELYNPNNFPVVLTGYRIVLYEGLNNKVTDSFFLNGTIPAKGFYVIGSPAVPNVNFVRPVEFSSTNELDGGKWLQSWPFGGTGVALLNGSTQGYFSNGSIAPQPNDSQFTFFQSKIVDAVVNTHGGSPSPTLISFLTPNQIDVRDWDYTYNAPTYSVGRKTDGAGQVRQTGQWSKLIPTPGVSNNGNDNLTNPARQYHKVRSVNNVSLPAAIVEGSGDATIELLVGGQFDMTRDYVARAVSLDPRVEIDQTLYNPTFPMLYNAETSRSGPIKIKVKDDSVIAPNGFDYAYIRVEPVDPTIPMQAVTGWIKIIDNDGVNPPANNVPKIDIKANGSDEAITVTAGARVNLTWSTANSQYLPTSAAVTGSYRCGPNGVIYNSTVFNNKLTGSYIEDTTPHAGCRMEYTVKVGNTSDVVIVNVNSSTVTPPPTPSATPSISFKVNNNKSVVVTEGDLVTLNWSTANIHHVTATYEPIVNYPINYIGANCPAKGNSTALAKVGGPYAVSEITAGRANCTMKYVINGYNAANQLIAQEYTTIEVKPKNNPVAPQGLPSPTASLTIGGTNGTYNAAVGSTVRFVWSSQNADNGYAKMEGTTVACGQGYPRTTSIVMGANGTYDMKVPAEYAGCTYKYTFYASHSNGKVGEAVAYLTVPAAANPNNVAAPTANLLANGQKDITVYATAGTTVNLTWTSTNATAFKGRLEGLDADGYACGSNSFPVVAANGSYTINVMGGYANCDYVYSVTMTNSAGQSVTSSVKVKYIAPLSSYSDSVTGVVAGASTDNSDAMPISAGIETIKNIIQVFALSL